MNWEELTTTQKALIRELSNQSLQFYARTTFRFAEGIKMMNNWHVMLMCDELEKIETGETECLILNVPPGSGKTHVASVSFPSRGYARNPKCRFLTVSYSQLAG